MVCSLHGLLAGLEAGSFFGVGTKALQLEYLQVRTSTVQRKAGSPQLTAHSRQQPQQLTAGSWQPAAHSW